MLFANTTRHHGCSVNTVRVCRSVITARKHRYIECTDPKRGGCAAAVGVTTGYTSVGKPHLAGNERRQCMDKRTPTFDCGLVTATPKKSLP